MRLFGQIICIHVVNVFNCLYSFVYLDFHSPNRPTICRPKNVRYEINPCNASTLLIHTHSSY